MTAITWDEARTWEPARRGRERRPHLRVATAPPARRRPSAAVIRRRRLVAVTLFVLLALGGVRLGERWLGATAEAGAVAPAPVVLVAQSGDTYWGLASRVSPGGDIRSTVDSLVRANGGRELRAGDRIRLSE